MLVVAVVLVLVRSDRQGRIPLEVAVVPQPATSPKDDGLDVLRAVRLRLATEAVLRAIAKRDEWNVDDLPPGSTVDELGELQRLHYIAIDGPSTSEERLFYAREGKPAPPVVVRPTELGRKWIEAHPVARPGR